MVLYCLLLYQRAGDIVSVTPQHLTGILLILLTQYVVSPYDNLSYFLLLLSYLLIVRPFRFSLPILLAVFVAGVLTRETAALTLSFYFLPIIISS